MGYTIRQFVDAAHTEIGLASYVFDMPPEQLESSKRRLDAMMAEWNAKGVRLGYPIPTNAGGGDLDDDAGVPDSAWEAIITNLAIRIAPSFGKQVMQDTKAAAKRAYSTLLALATFPPEMQLPANMPAGAGNKPWRNENPFLRPPCDPLAAGPDGPLEFN